MAAAASPVSDTECSICHEPFTEPKLIPCGHLLCQKCVVSWLKSQRDAQCPLCRAPIVDPQQQGSRSVEEIVDSFPTDIVMKAEVELEELVSKDHTCESCQKETASSKCLTCCDLLCSSCAACHRRLRSTRSHNVEDISSLTVEKLVASQTTPCSTHPEESTKLYCPKHESAICLLCATSRHRSCPELKDLEEQAEEISTILSSLSDRLKKIEERMDEDITELDQHIEKTGKTAQSAIKEIEKACDQLEASVKACRQRLKDLVLSMSSDEMERARKRKSLLVQHRGRARSHRDIVERVKGRKCGGEVFEMTTVMKGRVNDLDLPITFPTDVKAISEVMVVMDKGAVSKVEKILSELGQVKTAPVALSSDPVLRFHTNCGDNIVFSNNQQTAERKGSGNDGGIVVACDSMLPDRLYEVCLHQRDAFSGWYMWVGVTTAAPDTLTVPPMAYQWKSAVVINNDSVDECGSRTFTNVGQKLVDLPQGSRVGLRVDTQKTLHLYINGQHQGVAAHNVTQPCFAFFDVFGPYRKITALPVTIVQ